MFRLIFLEKASEDIAHYAEQIYGYTGYPSTVEKYLDSIQAACSQIAEFPYGCAVYRAAHSLDLEFRRKPVGKYNLYYVVNETDRTVIIARLILSRTEEKL